MWDKHSASSLRGMSPYQNLRPGDRHDPQQPRFELFEEDGRWFTRNASGTCVRTATGRYDFVTVRGMIYVERHGRRSHSFSRAVGHIDLARGLLVDYAGEVRFSGRRNRGILRLWSNASGHYQPSPEDHSKACLPTGEFERFDEL